LSLQKLNNNKKTFLSEEDKILWELFTRNLNKSSKINQNKAILKDENFKNNIKKLDELKLGQGIALSKKNIKDFSKGNVFIDKKLDLHGFNLVEAKNLLKNFINQSVKNNKRLILVITGKGKEGEGAIKNNIVSWLNTKDLRNKILAVNYASKKHGGTGAIYILLKKF
jgi:DNA-nicking Smr family endonuclease